MCLIIMGIMAIGSIGLIVIGALGGNTEQAFGEILFGIEGLVATAIVFFIWFVVKSIIGRREQRLDVRISAKEAARAILEQGMVSEFDNDMFNKICAILAKNTDRESIELLERLRNLKKG